MAIELLGGRNTGCVISAETGKDGIKRTDVEIKTGGAAKRLGKPKGLYSTIEIPEACRKDAKGQMHAAEAVRKAVAKLLDGNIGKKKYTALVAGLGNASMTADSLGPRVCQKLIVTRHSQGSFAESGGHVQSLCAISPGVYGVTGIETYDIIAGLADKIMPDAVIAVDSLSSRAVSRLAAAFQVTDSGISPGSGVNNHRFRLDKKTLGIPVIAVGVPLVVYASVIAEEVMDKVLLAHAEISKEPAIPHDENLVNSVIGDVLGDMVVTPKDIDAICGDCAHIIALAINAAVHGMSIENAYKFMV